MYKKNKSPFAKTAAKQNLCPAPTMEGNPQEQDVDLLHPRSTLSTHPCWKPSGVESRTALASRATRGPGARSCCSLSLPAAPLQNTAKSKIPVWARGSLHVSAPTTISHGREEEGQAASALVEHGLPTPPNTRWFGKSGKDCETRVTELEKQKRNYSEKLCELPNKPLVLPAQGALAALLW